MTKFFILFLIVFSSTINISAQELNLFPPTTAAERIEAYEQRLKLNENSLVKNLMLRSIGPTAMSGRVVDLDVSPNDPSIFYVAYASGGLWKTTNNGISFFPLFDDQASITIGDIAVDWNNGETIWVGTGENNSSRSSYAGTGIYKSNDTGKTWHLMGLGETQHTGRIILHPDNPDILWVAALGHLYSPNQERGIYKSTDAGISWIHTLFIDDNTGAIDLVIDPASPDVLYASMWHRTRRAWNFVESGSTSGIYKSVNGGDDWSLISSNESGFPTGEGVGRIGLAVFPKNSQIIYAFLDNQFRREDEEKEDDILTKDELRKMGSGDFLKLEEALINHFLDIQNFPAEYTAEKIIDMVKDGKITPAGLVEYLEDANALLFDVPVIGPEVYRSDDAGKTWEKTHEKFIEEMYYSYGYYFGEIRVDANDENKIYLLGVPIIKSDDGGKTFTSINEGNVHVDHHAMWINPNKTGHLILGNDGGINITYDDGKSWFKANSPAVSQFYTVAVDMAQPYNVYGGTQDNGVWVGPSTNKPNTDWHATGRYPFDWIMGGDGMQIAVDTSDNNTVYTGYQFGFYFRLERDKNTSVSIKPVHKLGERPLRFNWQTPIHLSKHNKEIFYIGSNKLHRSLDKGDNYETISDDLTKGGKKGDVPYGTLTSIDESPFKFGLLYAGTDDGLIHISQDGGNSWENISYSLPQDLWVSRVYASRHDSGVVYASLNGYRWDHFNSYIYKSTNFGKDWLRLGSDLPTEPVNVIKEDPVNKNLIYVGTDHALYVSIDGGNNFMGMNSGMPFAPVHDLVIHPRDNEIVIGTHGRSIYIGDVRHLQQLTEEILKKNFHFFLAKENAFNENWGNKSYTWGDINEPEFNFVYYSKNNGIAKIKITTEQGDLLNEFSDTTDAGLNYFSYDLSISKKREDFYKNFVNKNRGEKEKDKFKKNETEKIYLRPGKYIVEIELNGNKEKQTFEISEPKGKTKRSEKKIP